MAGLLIATARWGTYG